MGERTRGWEIYLVNEVRDWLEDIRTDDPVTFDLVEDAIYALSRSGPALKRPLVGTLSGSTIKNLKELRPGSSGTSEIRILFCLRPVAISDSARRRGQGRELAAVVSPSDPPG